MKLGIIRKYDSAGFDYAKNKGLDFIEICCNTDDETKDFNASANHIKEEIIRTGITVQSVGRWGAEPNKAGKVDDDLFESLCRSIDTVGYIGAPVFVCGVNYDESISLYRNLSFAVEYIGRLSEHARSKNVQLAVYNCEWNNFVHNSQMWKIVLGELTDVKIKYDCSHSYNRGTDYLSELNEWADKVAHMHIKGSINLGGKHLDDPPAGLDALDWPQIFGIMYAHKYSGGFSIEPHSMVWQGELGEKGIDFTIGYVNKMLLR